jgi:hypothetical protein
MFFGRTRGDLLLPPADDVFGIGPLKAAITLKGDAMFNLNLFGLTEFAATIWLLWYGFYVFTRSPKSAFARTTLLVATLLAMLTFNLGILTVVESPEEYRIGVRLLWLWATWPPVLWFHGVSLIQVQELHVRHSRWLPVLYALAALFTVVGLTTRWLFDYEQIVVTTIPGRPYSVLPQPLYLAFSVFVVGTTGGASLNLYHLRTRAPLVSVTRESLDYLLWGSLLFTLGGAYNTLVFWWFREPWTWPAVGEILVAIGLVPIAFQIWRYKALGVEQVFVWDLLYCFFGILIITLVYVVAVFSVAAILSIPFSISLLILMLVVLCLVVITHLLYDWVMTLARGLIYTHLRQLFEEAPPVAVIRSVEEAVQHYQRPHQLTASPLLNLRLVREKMGISREQTGVDALRAVIREAIEWQKPENIRRRTRAALKYKLLSMIAFDEAEEGQVLWELGFEEYSRKVGEDVAPKSRPPLYPVREKSEYYAVSRASYMRLKQEAIYDVAWRIWYLEQAWQAATPPGSESRLSGTLPSEPGQRLGS